MKPVRSLGQLQVDLDDQLSWRLQEIHVLQSGSRNVGQVAENAHRRAFVTMLYAHWEGFIRASSISYSSYLSNINLKYSEVLDCFRGLSAVAKVCEAERLRKRLFAPSTLLVALSNISLEKVDLPLRRYISRVGNLDYELFAEIMDLLGFDLAHYETKRVIIDNS